MMSNFSDCGASFCQGQVDRKYISRKKGYGPPLPASSYFTKSQSGQFFQDPSPAVFLPRPRQRKCVDTSEGSYLLCYVRARTASQMICEVVTLQKGLNLASVFDIPNFDKSEWIRTNKISKLALFC